jgi:hypothetical protein
MNKKKFFKYSFIEILNQIFSVKNSYSGERMDDSLHNVIIKFEKDKISSLRK